MSPLATLALLPFAVVACGSSGTSDVQSSGDETRGPHALVIEHVYEESSEGALYVEGALSEVIVRDAAGVWRTVRGPVEASLTVDGLLPGTYQVEPGLRPCAGNCDNLDPRTDVCEVTVTVPQDTTVRVRYVVTEGCSAVAR